MGDAKFSISSSDFQDMFQVKVTHRGNMFPNSNVRFTIERALPSSQQQVKKKVRLDVVKLSLGESEKQCGNQSQFGINIGD